MTSRVVRLLAVGLLALAVTMAGPVAPSGAGVDDPAPRKAEAYWDTYSKKVIDYGSAELAHLDMCVWFNYSALFKVRVGGTKGPIEPPAYHIWEFKNPRMINPSLDVYFTRKCEFGSRELKSSRLVSRASINAARLKRDFCDFNPSVGISAPWGISVGVAPSCDTDEARRASRYRVNEPRNPQHRFEVASTGEAAEWTKNSESFLFKRTDKRVKLCFRGRYYFDVQNASGSRSDDITINGTRNQMCLPVAYWAWDVTGRDY